MLLQRNYRYLRLILIAIPVVLFFWLIAKDFAFSGRLDMSYDFSRDSPFVKRPWPPGRFHDIAYDKATGDAWTRMFVEPATFAVKLPRKFSSATVEVLYQKDATQPLRVGIRMHPEKWAWEIRDLEALGEENGWTRGRVRFDDIGRAPFIDQKLQFLLNAPGLFEDQREVALTAIRVIVEKEPTTLRNFFHDYGATSVRNTPASRYFSHCACDVCCLFFCRSYKTGACDELHQSECVASFCYCKRHYNNSVDRG